MPKEIKMYEASDGKLFKSKQGAENYEKRIASIKKMNELNMDREEIQANLERIANHNTIVRVLLNNEKNWTNGLHIILKPLISNYSSLIKQLFM